MLTKSTENIYLGTKIRSASLINALLLEINQVQSDSEKDPRSDCSCCKKEEKLDIYETIKSVYILENRFYKFTYYNENKCYDNMICEVLHINAYDNYTDEGFIEVKAYLTEDDIKRKVYANIKHIPIGNIIDAIDITPTVNPITGDDIKVMLLGISAKKIRGLIINLKLINDKISEAIKEINMIIGQSYCVSYVDKNNIDTIHKITGKLVGLKEIPVLDPMVKDDTNTGVVREDCSCCEYPDFNKYYNPCDKCPIEQVSFGNNVYIEIDKFLSLPEKMIQDVLITFNIAAEYEEENLVKFYLSQIRDICVKSVEPDPAYTNLEISSINQDMIIKTKNARLIAIKDGIIDKDWKDADIKPSDIIGLYPVDQRPLFYSNSIDGDYTIFAEFKDGTHDKKYINYDGIYRDISYRLHDFVHKFNNWIIKNFHNEKDYLKPLFDVSIDSENNVFTFNINYYNLDKYSHANTFFKLLNPKVIDDLFVNVFQTSLNASMDISIDGNEIYNKGELNINSFYNYIKTIIIRILNDLKNQSSIDDNIYTLNNSDKVTYTIFDTVYNEYDIHYTITYENEEDKEELDNKIIAIDNIMSFSSDIGSDLGYKDCKTDNVLIMNINNGNALKTYLDAISSDRRTAINTFNIYRFLSIFNSINVMEDAIIEGIDYSSTYNNLLKIVCRNQRSICHLLSNLCGKIQTTDGYECVVGEDKIFKMEEIDKDAELYDPKGFYKMIEAFINFFSDELLSTKMNKFDLENISTEYENSKLFNFISRWYIGSLGNISIPFTINFNIFTKDE